MKKNKAACSYGNRNLSEVAEMPCEKSSRTVLRLAKPLSIWQLLPGELVSDATHFFLLSSVHALHRAIRHRAQMREIVMPIVL
jgi:hypothetical protein